MHDIIHVLNFAIIMQVVKQFSHKFVHKTKQIQNLCYTIVHTYEGNKINNMIISILT